MQTNIKSWANTDDEENAMNDDHYDLWEHMIDICIEQPLHGKTVLDYGCNQGGFLDLLYKRHPFKNATGVDIATESLGVAAERLVGKPVTFGTPDDLGSPEMRGTFDIAFSHEVMYLLPDLAEHAAKIHSVLKPRGTYYAVIGCHTDQPLWKDWLSLISEYSNVPVRSYALDDYANAFIDAGFTASVQPFRMNGFFPLKQNNPYFPRVADTLRYYEKDKVIFRFDKSAAHPTHPAIAEA